MRLSRTFKSLVTVMAFASVFVGVALIKSPTVQSQKGKENQESRMGQSVGQPAKTMSDHDIHARYEYSSAVPCIEGPQDPSVLDNDCE